MNTLECLNEHLNAVLTLIVFVPDTRLISGSVVLNIQVLVQHLHNLCLTPTSFQEVLCWTLECINEHSSAHSTLARLCLTLTLIPGSIKIYTRV